MEKEAWMMELGEGVINRLSGAEAGAQERFCCPHVPGLSHSSRSGEQKAC